MTDLSDVEPPRGEFKGLGRKIKINPITGRPEKVSECLRVSFLLVLCCVCSPPMVCLRTSQWYPSILRKLKYPISLGTINVMIAIVLIILVGTIVYRLAISTMLLKRDKEDTLGANGVWASLLMFSLSRSCAHNTVAVSPATSVCHCVSFCRCAQPCGHFDPRLLLLVCCCVPDKLGEPQDCICVRGAPHLQDCRLPVCQHVLVSLLHRIFQGIHCLGVV